MNAWRSRRYVEETSGGSYSSGRLYLEGAEAGGVGAASTEGFMYFWDIAMPTAAQVIDVAARIILPSMFDVIETMLGPDIGIEYGVCALGRRVFRESNRFGDVKVYTEQWPK
jgi:hypothetical protein